MIFSQILQLQVANASFKQVEVVGVKDKFLQYIDCAWNIGFSVDGQYLDVYLTDQTKTSAPNLTDSGIVGSKGLSSEGAAYINKKWCSFRMFNYHVNDKFYISIYNSSGSTLQFLVRVYYSDKALEVNF